MSKLYFVSMSHLFYVWSMLLSLSVYQRMILWSLSNKILKNLTIISIYLVHFTKLCLFSVEDFLSELPISLFIIIGITYRMSPVNLYIKSSSLNQLGLLQPKFAIIILILEYWVSYLTNMSDEPRLPTNIVAMAKLEHKGQFKYCQLSSKLYKENVT